MKINFRLISPLLLAALLIAGCNDFNEIDAPIKNSTSGTANFSRFVSIGNSITAGYQSGTIYQSGQMYCYGNLIAQRVGTPYEIPYVSDPGLGGRMEIQSLSPFTIYYNQSSGSLLNSNYPAPYNNLGIPGALLYDVLYAKNSTTCASFVFSNTPNPYFDVILRGKGTTQIEQALSLAPTFITIWIGNNDVLGYATSGGTSPATPTDPTTQFGPLFGGIAQGLAQFKTQASANFGVAIGNIPNVAAIPFFTTVGPQVASNPLVKWWQIRLMQQAAGLPATGLIYASHEGGTNLGGLLPYKIGFADSAALLQAATLITLKGSSYAPLLGKPTGKFYRDLNIPLPLGVDTTKLFGFDPQNPFPDPLVLDQDEITTANNAVTAFNTIISNIVGSLNQQGIPSALVNINSVFNEFIAGKNVNGINFKTTYVSGGLFSLDGVHPSSQAHGIVANEFIKAINTKFGANIPLVDVSSIPGSFFLMSKLAYRDGYPIIPIEAFDHLLF